MKTNRIILALVLFFSFTGYSQVERNAIGVRGGPGTFGYGGEISYQHGFNTRNRLELDLGWNGHHYYHKGYHRHNALGVSGIYHWVWNIDRGLNWFVGPGAQIGTYSYYTRDDVYYNGMILNVGGQIGLEYNFNAHGAPIQLGLDARPMWGFMGDLYHGFGYGGALSLRYTF